MASLKELSGEIDKQLAPIREAARFAKEAARAAMLLPEYAALQSAEAKVWIADRNARGEPGDMGGPAPYDHRSMEAPEEARDTAIQTFHKRLIAEGISEENLPLVLEGIDDIQREQEKGPRRG